MTGGSKPKVSKIERRNSNSGLEFYVKNWVR